jgi:hypothetical protein
LVAIAQKIAEEWGAIAVKRKTIQTTGDDFRMAFQLLSAQKTRQ